MMRILFDCRAERMYPLGKEGFSGGSQTYLKAIVKGLANNGHVVHIIAPDLEMDEQRGPNEYWWPPTYFPRQFDVAIQQMHLNSSPEYDAPIFILMTSCVDPYLGPEHQWGEKVDAYPIFSETHGKLLRALRPTVPEDRLFVTGLGVDVDDYLPYMDADEFGIIDVTTFPRILKGQNAWIEEHKVPGRMLYANDPARGLFYTLDVFDRVKRRVPDATLHVAYDFDTQLSWRKWEHSHMAQMLLECKQRIDATPGVVNLGGVSRQQIIKEQLECQVHCMPSDPPGIGTQTHGITQIECAAAGCALVLSDIEAFPEVFGEGATILPVIGKYMAEYERRCKADDYAEVVVELMEDPEKWAEASRKARALAEANTWGHVVGKWEEMLAKLAGVCVG